MAGAGVISPDIELEQHRGGQWARWHMQVDDADGGDAGIRGGGFRLQIDDEVMGVDEAHAATSARLASTSCMAFS
ncbi:hypothetical protein D9M70_536510 [compost metagenome]